MNLKFLKFPVYFLKQDLPAIPVGPQQARLPVSATLRGVSWDVKGRIIERKTLWLRAEDVKMS